MENIVLASTGADAEAAQAVTGRHTELAGAVAMKTLHLLNALDAPDTTELAARDGLASWARNSLLPYLHREAEFFYPAVPSGAESTEIVRSLQTSIATIDELTAEVASLTDRQSLGAAAVSLRAMLTSHFETERTRLLPYLAFSRDRSIADLWTLVNERDTTMPSTDQPTASATHADGTACTCGEKDDADFPPLDVRNVPHAIRHAVVFGALDAVKPQAGIVLIAPHDPLPLLAQIEQRTPGRFAREYIVRKPAEVHIRLTRVA